MVPKEELVFKIIGKKRFSFRGCGWKAINTAAWTEEMKQWILVTADLFDQMFGGDFLKFKYDKDHGTKIDGSVAANILEYSHNHWEKMYCSHKAEGNDDEAKSLCHPRCNLAETIPTKKQRTTSKRSLLQDSSSPITNPSPKTVVLEDDKEATEIKAESSFLQKAFHKTTSRAEVAALYHLLPPVASQSSAKLTPVSDRLCASDPFTLSERPCESDIDKAQELLRGEQNTGKNPTGIEIEGKGEFSATSLSVLKQFCRIAETYHKVSSERNWLLGMDCTPRDLALIQDALWHHPATCPFLRNERKGIDPTSFSDLVEERYIDSFIIDICISKILDETRVGGRSHTVYFPTEVFLWLESRDKTFVQKQLADTISRSSDGDTLQQILLPVHMPNHWGLVFIDLLHSALYFDDGLKTIVPFSLLSTIKQLLDLLSEMCATNVALQTKFWECVLSFQRFGMPSQVAVDSRMIGMGSCGVGVIMAARDFIVRGPSSINNFQWQYCEMHVHRRNLMLQILKWRK